MAVALTATVWICLAAASLVLDEWNLTQLAQYMAYGIFALGLAFLWGQVGLLSFGQAIFFGIGAYAMALVNLGRLPFVGGTTIVGLVLALVLPAICAYVLGRLLFYGRGLSGAFFAIVTLSAAMIAQVAARRWDFIGGFNGMFGIPPLAAPWREGTAAMLSARETYVVLLLVALVVYLALLSLVRSPIGTVLAAIRDDDYRTSFFGYDITRWKTWAFVISASVSGLAGALFVKLFGFVSPALIGFALSTEVLIWVAVGGRSVLLAAFLGAILVRSVEGTLSDRLGDYWLLATGILFVVVVVFMPMGLFGRLLTLPPSRRLRPDTVESMRRPS